MWMLIGAILVIAIATSTREGRAEARERMARYNPYLWAALAVIWGILLFPW